MSDLVEQFARLLEQAGPDSGGSTATLLRALPPQVAAHLRLCAIPHEFNPTVLQVLVPALDGAASQARCEEFAQLSCVVPAPDGWALHDSARTELFREWLRGADENGFRAASARLAKYFQNRLATAGRDDSLRVRHMFHLFGADAARGLAEFESLFREARREHRPAVCANLLRLIDEYEPVLLPAQRATLTYFCAKLASDTRQWEQAIELFDTALAATNGDAGLKRNVHLGLGYVFCEQGNLPKAGEHYEAALQLAESADSETYGIVRSLGEVCRDRGWFDRAAELLGESLAGARQAGDLIAVGDAYNSLGTLFRLRRNPERAIECYQESIAHLAASGMRFELAKVYNNLGTALVDAGRWDEAEKAYEESVSIKVAAGDTVGHARSLINLVHVYRHRQRSDLALEACERAFSLFEEIRHVSGMGWAKHALGRIRASDGDTAAARQSLTEAMALFERAGESRAVAQVRHEMQALDARGLPWWAWVALALTVIVIVAGGLGFVWLLRG